MTTIEPIDLDLVDRIIEHIPNHTWSFVKCSIIEYFVDNMTSNILQRLTNDPQGFSRAEDILHDHYVLPDMQKDLIIDLIKITGIENTINLLDRLQLDKINFVQEQKEDE